MMYTLCVLSLVLLYTEAVPEVNHLVQTDRHGQTVSMDVIHDIEDKTVIAIIGDVSQYKNSEPTVNFHDYSTGYGVLKDINKQICILTKSPVPMATAEKYRMGVTDEVHEHFLKFVPIKLSYDDVKSIAGTKLATFCKDYTTVLANVSPIEETKRDVTSAPETAKWCVFSSCKYSPDELGTVIDTIGK